MEDDEVFSVVEMGLRGDDQSVRPLHQIWEEPPVRTKVQFVTLYRQLPEMFVNFTIRKVNATRRSVQCQECNKLLAWKSSELDLARTHMKEHTRYHWDRTLGLKDRAELPEVLKGHYRFGSIDVLQTDSRQYEERILEAAAAYRQAVIEEAEMAADVRLVTATSTDPERRQSMGYKMTAASTHVQNTKHTLFNYILAGGE